MERDVCFLFGVQPVFNEKEKKIWEKGERQKKAKKKKKVMLQGNINQTVSMPTGEGEGGEESRRQFKKAVKEPRCFLHKAGALGYHSVLRGRKLNWSWQKGFY